MSNNLYPTCNISLQHVLHLLLLISLQHISFNYLSLQHALYLSFMFALQAFASSLVSHPRRPLATPILAIFYPL